MTYEFKILEDKEIWNNFVANFPATESGIYRTTFTQSYNWLEFQERLGKKVLKLGIYDGDKLVGVCAGVVIDAKRGRYLYCRNGAVLDWSNHKLVDQTINYLKKWAKENKLWFVRVSPLIEINSDEEHTLKSYNYPICPMNDVEALDTWIMPLELQGEGDRENVVFESIKKKTRYLIRKAEKDGATVEISNDSKDIDKYYEILKDTVKRQGWNAYSKDYIRSEFESFNKDGSASIILIKFEDKYIAGGIFIHFGGQSFYHYGASLSEYKHIPGAYLMIWEAIKIALEKNYKYFNFWGIAPENRPDHPWQGLSKFKMKFPGFEQRWSPCRDIPVSPLYWMTNLYERIDKKRKGY